MRSCHAPLPDGDASVPPFAAMLDRVADAVFALDGDWRLAYVNARAAGMLGATREALVGRLAWEVLPASTDAAFERACRRAVESRVPTVFEAHFATLGLRVEGDAAPTAGGVVVCCRDVGERRRMEAALCERDTLLRETQEIAGVGSWSYDLRTGVTAWSDELYRLQGLSPHVLPPSYELFIGAVHADDRARVAGDIETAMRTGRGYAHDYRVVRPDGEIRTHHCRGRTVLGDDGAVVRVLGTCQDITERTRTESALRESEERLRLALSAARMVAWELDLRSGRLCTIAAPDDPTLAIAGPGGAGTYESFLGFLHPDDRAAVEAAAARAFAEQADAQVEFRVVLPNGEVRWRHVIGRVLRTGGDGPERMMGVGLDVTDRKALEQELTWQAHHDALTGLANRARFHERIAGALARARDRDGTPARADAGGSAPALLLIDLDDFKTVNDSLGHGAGDRLLRIVAERLLDATRGTDTVARLGGDEFGVLLGAVRELSEAALVADRVVAALTAPYVLDGREVRVGASVGIAVAQRGDDPDVLLRNADLALYRAKALGKSRHETFAPAMYAAAVERLELEAELQRAIARRELVLHYQPIIELATGAVAGVEALVRWIHPERGVVPPAAFIPIAEATGLIVPLGRLVLDAACRAAAEWRALGAHATTVAVNVSGRQLQHATFVEDVAAVLHASGLAPQRLVLEVTESVLLADLETALGRLEALRALGVQLALDDFGTGYSSLAYLQRLPVDVLKIDRTFTADLTAGGRRSAVARAVGMFAGALGLRTVAEGIETPEQHAELAALGCGFGQGYLYAPPLAPAALEEFLRARRPAAVLASHAGATHAGATPGVIATRAGGRHAARTVLVVDDEAAVRQAVRTLLARAGYEVLEARDGADALRCLATHAAGIDVVLTDVEMPELTGPALAGALASCAPEVRVLFMSGGDPDRLRRYGARVPAGSLLCKPFTPQQLLDAVSTCLADDRVDGCPIVRRAG